MGLEYVLPPCAHRPARAPIGNRRVSLLRTVRRADVPLNCGPRSLNPLVQSGRPISVKAAQSLGSGKLSLVDRMADLRAATLLWPPNVRVGITAVLHTWGSAMTHHPHVHMIVGGGGLSDDGGRWISSPSKPSLSSKVITLPTSGFAAVAKRRSPYISSQTTTTWSDQDCAT
jgi:Putative transposase